VAHVEAYSRLAGVYDEIVIDPCHDRWASFLHELWSTDPEGVRSVIRLLGLWPETSNTEVR